MTTTVRHCSHLPVKQEKQLWIEGPCQHLMSLADIARAEAYVTGRDTETEDMSF